MQKNIKAMETALIAIEADGPMPPSGKYANNDPKIIATTSSMNFAKVLIAHPYMAVDPETSVQVRYRLELRPRIKDFRSWACRARKLTPPLLAMGEPDCEVSAHVRAPESPASV